MLLLSEMLHLSETSSWWRCSSYRIYSICRPAIRDAPAVGDAQANEDAVGDAPAVRDAPSCLRCTSCRRCSSCWVDAPAVGDSLLQLSARHAQHNTRVLNIKINAGSPERHNVQAVGASIAKPRKPQKNILLITAHTALNSIELQLGGAILIAVDWGHLFFS